MMKSYKHLLYVFPQFLRCSVGFRAGNTNRAAFADAGIVPGDSWLDVKINNSLVKAIYKQVRGSRDQIY